MMRKDVKLGFAIGGVLLAVVVVYALVGTGSKDANNNGGAGIVTEEPSGNNPTAGATAEAKTPAKPESAKTEEPTSIANADKPALPPDSHPPATAPSSGTNGAADSIASAALRKPAEGAHDANGDLWDKALNSGELMLSQTPTPVSGASGDKSIPGGGVERRDTAQPTGDAQQPTPAETQARANGPATLARAADAGASGNSSSPSSSSSSSSSSLSSNSSRPMTHVVQKDETLALISKAVYGSPNYYPHILRANPGLDPKKLKPGMTITLPPLSDVKPNSNGEPASAGGSSAGGSSGKSTIDPKTQYVVESGDTLERIALKLYGKREMIDKIYELNKQTLPDRNKLKLHQVLRLPEPPTQTASR
jgi:nucleoid-associated protein YgaU